MNADIGQASLNAADARLMEACEWVMRLQGSDLDEQVTAQWLEWCQADRNNLAAFEGVRTLWNSFGDARLSAALAPAVTDSNPPAAATQAPLAPRAMRDLPGVRSFDLRARRHWRLAAMLLIGIGGAVWVSEQRVTQNYTQTFSTAVGSLSRQTLPDGSVVELGARSAVRVHLTHERRSVFVEDGEAFFQVAKDPNRPFMVQAGELQVVAVGTAFNVRKAEDRVVVTVKEGAVRVAPNAGSAALGQTREGVKESWPAESTDGQVRAGAGHQVTYSKRQHAITMTAFEPTPHASAWQVGRLEFVNEPLATVIADVNRYSQRSIALADPDLSALTFSGTVRSDAVDDWLRGLKDVFPLEVIDRGAGDILLVHRPR